MPRTPLIAGNWKMNGLRESLAVVEAVGAGAPEGPDALLCPPTTLLAATAAVKGARLAVGGQDCHAAASGAHTGDVSAEMLADAGASAVILGHSERRADHGETDAQVRDKVEAAWRAGLLAIVCVGETLAEREAGRASEVVQTQLAGSVPDGADAARLVVAYEPVWAIGTGRRAEAADVAEIHAVARASLAERFGPDMAAATRILYGGSVKPDTAADLFALEDVDGALVGGASLKAEDFLAILRAA